MFATEKANENVGKAHLMLVMHNCHKKLSANAVFELRQWTKEVEKGMVPPLNPSNQVYGKFFAQFVILSSKFKILEYRDLKIK